ncbi:MAG: hypothetical protein Q4C01_07580 [Clostridia bacterium]|nr:hypothetical protein [Clostridia bacterium]
MEGNTDYPYAELAGMPHLKGFASFSFLYGDAECDEDVDSADAAAILRYVVKLPNSDLSPLGKSQSDVATAFSGEPDSSDAAAILRFVVKIIDSLDL